MAQTVQPPEMANTVGLDTDLLTVYGPIPYCWCTFAGRLRCSGRR